MNQHMLTNKGVSVLSSAACVVHDYELVFNLPSVSIVEPGYANLARKQGGSVHGICHEMSEADLIKMDSLESSYTRVTVPAVTYDGKELEVGVYIIDAEHNHSNRSLKMIKPSRRYLRVLVDGATEFKLNEEYISWLAARESTPPPAFQPSEAMQKQLASHIWSHAELVAHMDSHPDQFFVVIRGFVFEMTNVRAPKPYLIHYQNTTRRDGCASFIVAQRYGKGLPGSLEEVTPAQMQYVSATAMDYLSPQRASPCLGSIDDAAKWDAIPCRVD